MDEKVVEQVRIHYAEAATAVLTRGEAGSADAGCCGTDSACCGGASTLPAGEGAVFYGPDDAAQVPQAAMLASLGCGNPLVVADLLPGERVLDLGSGGGIDVLLSARRVGPTGFAYGVDMTAEMLQLARQNAAEAGATNVEFLEGRIEAVPLPDASVDVVISNCVINLSGDKSRVFREAARVLRPGGRFAVSDVVADAEMDGATKGDMQQWTGCIAGALTREQFERELVAAGFDAVEIRETHRVHEHACLLYTSDAADE